MINNVLNNITSRNPVPYQLVKSHDLPVSETPAIIAIGAVVASICFCFFFFCFFFFIFSSYELSMETAITGLRYHHTLQRDVLR